jgi:hypothetical protein
MASTHNIKINSLAELKTDSKNKLNNDVASSDIHPPVAYFHLQIRSDLETRFKSITSSQRDYTEYEAISWLESQARFSNKVKSMTKLGATFFLRKGQFFTTKKWLASIFNWTEKKVRCSLLKWQKQGLVYTLPVKNPRNYTVGSIIHCRRIAQYDPKLALTSQLDYTKFKENLYKNLKEQLTKTNDRGSLSSQPVQKNLVQNWGSSFSFINQDNSQSGADVLNKNIKNLNINYKGTDLQNQAIWNQDLLIKKLIAEKIDLQHKANQKVVYFKNLLKKSNQEKKNLNRSKNLDWSFQELPEFTKLEIKLSKFGFNKSEINGIWWKYAQKSREESVADPAKIALLNDYIDYTEFRKQAGKVDDPRRFLRSALKRGYDLSKLVEMREQINSQEQKQIERDLFEKCERERVENEKKQREINEIKSQKRRDHLIDWIKTNSDHPIFEQTLKVFQATNLICYNLMHSEACKQELSDLEFMKLPKYSIKVALSGLYDKIDNFILKQKNSSPDAFIEVKNSNCSISCEMKIEIQNLLKNKIFESKNSTELTKLSQYCKIGDIEAVKIEVDNGNKLITCGYNKNYTKHSHNLENFGQNLQNIQPVSKFTPAGRVCEVQISGNLNSNKNAPAKTALNKAEANSLFGSFNSNKKSVSDLKQDSDYQKYHEWKMSDPVRWATYQLESRKTDLEIFEEWNAHRNSKAQTQNTKSTH